MELPPGEVHSFHPSNGEIKSESRRTASCSKVQKDGNKLVASVVKSEKHLNCEAMDTNNNNNTGDGEKDTTQNLSGMRAPSSSSNRIKADPLISTAGSGRRSSSGRIHSFGPSPYGLISPHDFPSICGTPTSVSQLFNLPSSAFSLDGIEFPSPLGSGHLSPLTSARLGRKRALSSVSPLSSSSLDLNNLIRTSPTSLVNYITTSRGSSAGSMGHLSPAFFANPALFQPPYTRPLFSLRNAAYPQMTTSVPLNSSDETTTGCKSGEGAVRVKMEIETEGNETQVPHHYRDGTGPNTAAMLDIVREEGASSGDEGMVTDHAGYSSAITENESELETKPGILKLEKTQRIYYSYPSVEEPHNNKCRWSECDKQCEDLEDLVRHVNTDHIYRDSRKDFVCYWSGCVREKRPFKAQYMLLVHMRRHTGEKPHKCTYEGCNKAYSRLENLKTHLRSHTGERPYVCKYEGCGKAFSNASDCAKHMNRTHSDEKPYACPNPGCMKRYTDPSSRRKHMKNCTANKKARTDDRDAMSGADEESCAETSSSKSTSKKTTKPKKSERKKPISFAPKVHVTTSADPGYVSGGSQGYVSSQTAGYNSSGYETEYPGFHGGEEEITRILQQQTLSDPLEPCALTYPPPNRGQFPHLTNHKPPSSHMIDHMTPNEKASRQKGGGLRMPAGRNAPPPHPHHHQMPPPHPFQFPPSFPSYQSCYSSFPEPHPPSIMPHMDTNTENNPPLSVHQDYLIARMSRNPSETASSGYSSFRSYSPGKPAGGNRRSPPSDDGSSIHGVRSSLQSTSYSTFSSNSSRLSSPCSNSGRSDSLRPHPPQSSMMSQFMNPKQVGRGNESSYPLRYSLQMKPSTYMRRHSEDVNSERSWRTYSSHSSRHSYSGSELTDDILDSLPVGSRRQSFTKTQPLPLPESMQQQLSNGSMEYQQNASGGDIGYSQMGIHEPTNQSTLPLHHLDNDETFTDHVSGHLYSQGMISEGYDGLRTTYFDDNTSNMVVGHMASFASALPEESQFLESLMSSQVK